MYAELIVSWDFMPEPRTEPNYFILDTDYTSYSIVYDCKQLAEDSMKETIYLLTREQHPTQELVEKGFLIMADLGLPTDTVDQTSQDNCDILPSLESASVDPALTPRHCFWIPEWLKECVDMSPAAIISPVLRDLPARPSVCS